MMAVGEPRSIQHRPIIHHCVSLGPDCHAGEFLRSNLWRPFSSPFDWIHSDAAMICACLDDACRSLLYRRDLDSTPAGLGLHRKLRTESHAAIFRHHNPAACDADFAKLHRAADRLRRVLDDEHSRTLFFHLQTDAASCHEGRRTFTADAHQMYKALSRCTSNFDLVAVRVVPRMSVSSSSELQVAGEAEETTLLSRSSSSRDSLLALELESRTRTVVPFSRLKKQGTRDELADMARLTAALERRFELAVRAEPPARSHRTDAARSACGPSWVWAEKSPERLLGPCARATREELDRALAMLPGGGDGGGRANGGGVEKDAADLTDETIDVATWAAAWVEAQQEGAVSVREWRAAAKRLATPSRRSASKADLVATVVGYQLAEMHAASRSEVSSFWKEV